MIKRLTLVLTFLCIGTAASAQEVYLSISGKNTPVQSGDTRNVYDIWIKPLAGAPEGRLEVYDAALGGAVDVVTQNTPNTNTTFSLYEFDAAYNLIDDGIRSKQVTTSPLQSLTTLNEERYINRWSTLASLPASNSNGFIVRVSTDGGDDVNSFSFRVVSPTGEILSGNSWKIIAVDLSIGVFNSRNSSLFQLKPYNLNAGESPRLVVSGQEDSRVRKMDSFGEEYDLNKSGIPAQKYGIENSWGLTISGSRDRINTLTVYGFQEPVLWLMEPFITDEETKPLLNINEVPTMGCVDKNFELAGNNFTNAELSNARWMLNNTQIASGRTPSIGFERPGTFNLTVLIPNNRSLLPEYFEYSKQVLINTPPVAVLSAPKTVISPSESITLNANGSSDAEGKPLSFSWFVNGSPRGNSPTYRFSSTISGNYTVTVRVSDGGSNPSCSVDEKQITIRVNTQPYAEINVTPLIGTDEEVQASIAYQTDADNDILQIMWSGVGLTGPKNQNAVTINHTEPGTYPISLTLNDGSGSSNSIYTVTKNYEVNAAPVPVFTLQQKAAPGDRIALNATESSDANGNPLQYRWFVNNNLISNEALASFQFSEPGIFDVKLVVDDGRGVSNSVQEITKKIRINTPPMPVITAAKMTSSSKVVFSAEQSQDTESSLDNYVWDFGDGNRATGARVVHTFAKAGEYRVTLQVNDGEGLSNSVRSAEHVLIINKYPKADFTAPVVVGPNEPFTLDGGASFDEDGTITSYEWYNEGELIGTGRTLTTQLNKTGNANISLRVKDDSGYELAEGIKTKRIRVNTPPVPVWTSDLDFVSPNTEIKFNADQSYDPDGEISQYIWEFDDGITLRGREIQRIFRESGPQGFTLTVVDSEKLPNSSSSIRGELKVNHQPLIITETVLRSNSLPIKLDATNSYDLDNNPLSYEWTLPDGSKRNESSFTWQAPEPGVHFIGLTVDDGLGLKNSVTTESIRVLINRPVKAVVEPEIASCTGQTVLFNSSQSFDPDGDPFSVKWDFGNGVTSEEANPTYVYEKPGVYEAKLTLDDGFSGQQSVTKIPVIIEGSPVAKLIASETTVCVNKSIRFDGSQSTDPSGNLPSLSWDTGDGKSHTGPVIDHIFTEPGIYSVTLTVEGSGSGRCSNVSQTTTTINVVEGPEAIFELPEYTEPGEVITLDGTASQAAGGVKTAKWIIDSENGQETLEGLNSSYRFDQPGEYLVTLEIQTNEETTCNTVSVTKSIKVNAPPVIAWELPENVAAGTDLKLDALQSSDPDGYIKEYKWYLDDGFVSNNAAEIIKAIEPGEHVITLEITDNSSATNNKVVQEKRFFANSKPSPSIVAPEKVYLNQTVSFQSGLGQDRDGDLVSTTWLLDGEPIPTPTFKAVNPQGYTVTLIQDDGRGLPNSVDSAIVEFIPLPLPVANPDLPKLIAEGGALSLPDIRMNNPWRFKNRGRYELTWTAQRAGEETLALAYIQDGVELTAQVFPIQVVPQLAFTEAVETRTIEWNPANPSFILRAPNVNRESTDVVYTWKQRGKTIGTGQQLGVVLVKGENRFTVQVSDEKVARSTPISIDIIIITE
jgi:PKD repeat protein